MLEFDDVKEADNKIPIGWLIFFIGVIIFLIWYFFKYTPKISGWSQYKVLEKEMKKDEKEFKKPLAENPYEHNKKAIVEGKMLYLSNCAGCHGKNLKGDIGSDLTGHLRYGETDDKKYETVSKGRSNGMPSFGQQLGRDRIWKILAYIDSVREYGAKP
jgi:cytochrome c oxidase cbb3-type subunit 3